MEIPHLVALALQADGWFLRSSIVWSKPNPMPESVTDRPTSSHEHVFLLSKRPAYYYDAGAIREEAAPWNSTVGFNVAGQSARNREGRIGARDDKEQTGRNCRNVWTIATQPFAESHFAVMPAALVERCIKAGSRPGDTVMDPFAGAFTSVMVADRLQRHAIGVELSADYVAMARARLLKDGGMFAEIVGTSAELSKCE